jgi:colanic acid biosynthesis glycosyl transferase WcaI
VNDLIPDTVISVGLIKNRFVIALLYRLERFIYKHADLISLVSESMRKNVLQKGVDEGKVVVRTDFIDTSVMHPYADDNGFRRKYGFEGKFLVVHTGNMGQKQGLSVVLRAAALLRDERDIIFLLIGGGNDIENLKRLQQSKGLESVRFLEVQPEEDYPKILSAADICLLVQKKDVKDICFPGKLLAYMSCGRPIIAAVDSDSETAIQVKESDSGVVIEPEDPKLLAETLRSLKGNRVFLHKLGENGSKYIRDNFEQAAVLGRFFETFQRVVRDGE